MSLTCSDVDKKRWNQKKHNEMKKERKMRTDPSEDMFYECFFFEPTTKVKRHLEA